LAAMENLRFLDLSRNNGVSRAGITALHKLLPHCSISPYYDR